LGDEKGFQYDDEDFIIDRRRLDHVKSEFIEISDYAKFRLFLARTLALKKYN